MWSIILFNSDSAYNVSLRQETLAKRIGDPVLVTNARMNRANILCTTGMYSETLAFMDTMRLCMLPEYLHPYYYHIKRTLYGLLADHAAFPGRETGISDQDRDVSRFDNEGKCSVIYSLCADEGGCSEQFRQSGGGCKSA